MTATSTQRVPISPGGTELDEWYNDTSAQVTPMSWREKRQFQRELRLAGLFGPRRGPGRGPLSFNNLTDEVRDALVQFHNALVRHTETDEDRLEYLDKQQDGLKDLANKLSKKEDLGAKEFFLADLVACTNWFKELLNLVEDLRPQG
ncbi:uncharacterized protein NECHADRAFT_79754 [Fusarium vanettenii 77-13-4]|uniref:Uncharacterized protein n=1 Tax=Fusarium vanettenii (strain ATCC MYA-4622 / CBS 123669 / FGSC 9596 / NRRL 45880 / 77-13-4) TaxID=660122 RepID=C7ZMF4_FUSV7|nr:uncharacterized protein NECHADRAFT_79754 [Fusarium vanettenii 77-13-4]EEU34799.1 predicted protein [Fusarium vanettenii 77-13-4]